MSFNKSLANEKLIEVGTILKNRRIEMQLSIVDLAVELNLNFHYIRLIESGDISVDSDVFYLGYISAIGKFLNLDENELLCYLNNSFKINSSDDQNIEHKEVKNIYSYIKNKDKNSNFKNKIELIIVSIIILICAIIYFVSTKI